MTMPTPAKPLHEETTYQMLIDSEEKERGMIEVFVYFLLIIATVASIWQFTREPVTFADLGVTHVQNATAVL